MTDVRTTGKQMQGQVLDTIQKSQEAVTDAIRAWAESVQSLTPSLPTASAPQTDKLPTPSEAVADAYDFAEQLLAAQRKFAEDVLQATAPVFTPKVGSKTGKSGPSRHVIQGSGARGGRACAVQCGHARATCAERTEPKADSA